MPEDMDALSQAAAIVEGMERGLIIDRIETLLKRYPNGMALFIISDGDLEDTHIVEVQTNASIIGAVALATVARENMINASVDWTDVPDDE